MTGRVPRHRHGWNRDDTLRLTFRRRFDLHRWSLRYFRDVFAIFLVVLKKTFYFDGDFVVWSISCDMVFVWVFGDFRRYTRQFAPVLIWFQGRGDYDYRDGERRHLPTSPLNYRARIATYSPAQQWMLSKKWYSTETIGQVPAFYFLTAVEYLGSDAWFGRVWYAGDRRFWKVEKTVQEWIAFCKTNVFIQPVFWLNEV